MDFIGEWQREHGHAPSLREIAQFFECQVNAAADHVRALKRKGFLASVAGRARSLQIKGLAAVRPTLDIPVFGSIPAGFARDSQQDKQGTISIDIELLGIKKTARTFALQVRGDSMIGRHIMDGDYVILEHGLTPRVGDVVAALIDNENTLKTYVLDKGKPALKAENPKYPQLVPAAELVIQGVMVGLVRKPKHLMKA